MQVFIDFPSSQAASTRVRMYAPRRTRQRIVNAVTAAATAAAHQIVCEYNKQNVEQKTTKQKFIAII